MNEQPPPRFISVKQAVERLGNAVSRHTVYRLIRAGKLKATRIGTRVLVEAESLADLICTGSIEAVTPRRPGKIPMPRRFKRFSLD